MDEALNRTGCPVMRILTQEAALHYSACVTYVKESKVFYLRYNAEIDPETIQINAHQRAKRTYLTRELCSSPSSVAGSAPSPGSPSSAV